MVCSSECNLEMMQSDLIKVGFYLCANKPTAARVCVQSTALFTLVLLHRGERSYEVAVLCRM